MQPRENGRALLPGGRDVSIFLAVAIALTLLTLLWSASGYYRNYHSIKRDRQRLLRVEELRGTIVYLDEVLTMSARMAASTGKQQWKQRYFDHKIQLDRVLEEARQISPDTAKRQGAEQTAQANIALISMEERAFQLIEEGHQEGALTLLTSDEYAQQKKVYARGMNTFSAGLQRVVQASIQQEQRYALVNLGISLVTFLVLILIWVRGYYLFQGWRNKLSQNAEQLNLELAERVSIEKQLEQIQRNLKKMVAERTAELETVNRELADENAIRIHAETQAKTLASQANAASRAKSEFLANMSHEIRTPMNAILGFSRILQTMEVDSTKQRHLASIQTSGKRLLGLIDDVLDLSRVEAGKLALDYTATSLTSIFRELELLFRQKAVEKGLEISFTISRGAPSSLLLDELRVCQVLINLVSNAIKFTQQGYVRVHALCVPATETINRTDFIVTVEDSGIGIDQDQQERIFNVFEQVDGQSTRQYGGTGLGLAIGRRLVELMGGTLTAKSTPGEGSVFTVCLKQVEIAPGKSVADPGDLVDFGNVRFDPATVLVADDVDSNREILALMLSDFGFKILEATNGEEALALARQRHPDVILMDMKMPVMDGFEATQALYDDPTIANIPVVAVTASALKEQKRAVSDLCAGFLSKPVNPHELLREMMRFVPHTSSEATDHHKTETEDSVELAVIKQNSELVDLLRSELPILQNDLTLGYLKKCVARINDLQSIAARHTCKPLDIWLTHLLANTESYKTTVCANDIEHLRQMLESDGRASQKVADSQPT